MSRGVSFTADETERLDYLPHLARLLYWALGIRRDYETGKVGVNPWVSWRSLAEALEVQPQPGIAGWRPSEKQLQRTNVHLIKAGLVVMQSNMLQRHLIFFLPLARRDFFAPNKVGNKPGDKAGRPLQRENTTKAGRPDRSKAGTHPVTDTYSHHLRESSGRGAVDNLVVSPSLREVEMELKNLIRLAPNVNGHAQAALDELAGAIAKGAIRKGPIPYFRGILRKIEQGTFTTTTPAKTQSKAQATTSPKSEGAGEGRASPGVREAAMAQIKGFLKVPMK